VLVRPARIWLAPMDGIHGRVWVWHARTSDPAGWGWSRTWLGALARLIDYQKEHLA